MDMNYKLKTNEELSQISGGGTGADVALGALSGAYQVGNSCIMAGPQIYFMCAAAGAVVGGYLAYVMRPPR